MAAKALSPQQWRELVESPTGRPNFMRKPSRVFFASHNQIPWLSPLPPSNHNDSSPTLRESPAILVAAAAAQYALERHSPGHRSQDSGFSGYSDSSDSPSVSPVNQNDITKKSPGREIPLTQAELSQLAATAEPELLTNAIHAVLQRPKLARHNSRSDFRRSAIYEQDESHSLEESLIRSSSQSSRFLETNLDSNSPFAHARDIPNAGPFVSRVYISSPGNPNEVNLDLQDVLVQKKVQAVNLCQNVPESSEDKISNKTLSPQIFCTSEKINNSDRSLLVPERQEESSNSRANGAWKKIGASFRKILPNGTTNDSNPGVSFNCMQTQAPASEVGDYEMDEDHQNPYSRILDTSTSTGSTEAGPSRSESPPTSRYTCGPRSSTPRRALKHGTSRRRCQSQQEILNPKEARLKVHWADSYSAEDLSSVDSVTTLSTVRQNSDSNLPNSSGSWDPNMTSFQMTGRVKDSIESDLQGHRLQLPVNASITDDSDMSTKLPGWRPRGRCGLRMGIGVTQSKLPSADLLNTPSVTTLPSKLQQKKLKTSYEDVNSYCSLPRPKNSDSRLNQGFRWNPVDTWLKDLPWLFQPESTCALQNKALVPQDSNSLSNVSLSSSNTFDPEYSQDLEYAMVTQAKLDIRHLQKRAHHISTQFAHLCQCMERWDTAVHSLLPILVGQVVQFARHTEAQLFGAVSPDVLNLMTVLRNTCMDMIELLRRISHVSVDSLALTADLKLANSYADPNPSFQAHFDWHLAKQTSATLGQAFVSIVDRLVDQKAQVFIEALRTTSSVAAAKLAAAALSTLGTENCHTFIHVLLKAMHFPHLTSARAEMLRALSSLCSSTQVIVDFEKAGGLEIVADVLCGKIESNEEEKSEAAGVLAQITSPWLDPPEQGASGNLTSESAPLLPALGLDKLLQRVIPALTDLTDRTDSEETLLLATAALANLTFSHGKAVHVMAQSGTASVLIAAAKRSQNNSMFFQDQVATVLANMANAAQAKQEVVKQGGLPTLLKFLQLKVSVLANANSAEVAACERVQKKAAIALSRLCVDEFVARQVAELGGIERMASLVREPVERNHSDGVLVACLAALHKISSVLGFNALRIHGAVDLVENRLLDVFLEHSTRPESYV